MGARLGRICKAIAPDLIPLLYEKYSFNLYHHEIDDFFSIVGANLEHVRHVALRSTHRWEQHRPAEIMGPRFAGAVRLRSLHMHLDHKDLRPWGARFRDCVIAEDFLRHLLNDQLPTLRTVHEAMQESKNQLSYGVLDVVKFIPPRLCYDSHSGCDTTRCLDCVANAHCAELNTSFCDMLATVLETR